MRRFVLPGVLVTAAIAVLALLTFGVSNSGDTTSIDALVASHKYPMAPNSHLALPVLGSSSTESLADFRGKVVVLNVFASWCPPCQGEAPLLSAEQQQLVQHGATLLGVTYLDNSVASEQFARQYHVTYPVLRDVSGQFDRALGVTGVPETFVINRQGRIQALQRNPVTRQWFSQVLPPIEARSA
jgi:cytochrome c biogenesis protein CcmG, thiol:disulfide interchange protein DsbE